MADHTCVIGMLHKHEYCELVTVDELKAYIAEKVEWNERLNHNRLARNIECLREKVWTVRDYCDWRRNTDLVRFRYCPDCGKAIDWKRIKEGE